jgi:hypothetical protein
MHWSRRSSAVWAVVLFSILAAMAANAQPRGGGQPAHFSLAVGAGPGFWLTGAPASFELGIQAGVEFQLTNRLALRALLPFEFSSSGSEAAGVQVSNLGYALIPRLEAAIQLVRDFALRLGAGIGPAHFRNTVTFVGEQTLTGTRLEIDLLTGMEYRVMDRLSFFFDPVRLRILPGTDSGRVRAGTVELTSPATSVAWTLLGGAAVRL